MEVDQKVIDWLVNSDPSVAFQTKRDILDLPLQEWIDDQDKILTEGW